jgi:hypothetical protein
VARSKTPDVLEQLYAAEPDAFVAERKRLEHLLRDEGRAEEAAELAKLRKPAVPVHAANRLARERADEVAKLVAAGERLASGHRSGDADELRGAQRELTEHVATLVHGAELSGVMEQRLAALLRAAATDPDSADLLRRGVLAEEVEPTAFDALAGVKVARPKRRPAAAKREPSAADARKRRRQVEKLEAELSEAKGALRTARRQVAAAEKERDRAERRVEQLTERVEQANQAV